MQIETKPLSPGLYFVATPIGTARDITLRALDILASADVIAAEDTRTAKHLMRIHGVSLGDRPVIAYHDHSGPDMRARIVQMISDGKSVAYASEAGTPLVADPGFQLSRAVIDAELPLIGAPGPSAVLAALTVSGLPTDKFMFAGFAPTAKGARKKWLTELTDLQATLVLYESPKRLYALLTDLVQTFGEERQAVVCRELTKKFEEVVRAPLAELAESFKDRAVKGEIVVLVDRAPVRVADEASLEDALRDALKSQSVKDAATDVAEALNLPRRQVYQAALKLAKDE
ncbi:16S rRNA (cytidine(1402)-2'-O)-methyltransferase [Actibacterium lipolyticum]|uniref:Ribosomal RNA small subunit methyltransferase I n=1 Tax=Actibacterium lipolyticum TaxID=1524263 RepID=A0A238JKM6_9RHOB|nr:16S rRNA (cytidine(1402)-2'-O)-methyltransferase [Actibacterium lipolyticum]SMX31228.1 Ribosomal RNA small subunit methyltransferase I [Actibacterium lipolyticum]